MNKSDFTIEVRIAWWLKPYFYALATISALSGREPDWEKVNYWIRKALTPKVVPVKK